MRVEAKNITLILFVLYNSYVIKKLREAIKRVYAGLPARLGVLWVQRDHFRYQPWVQLAKTGEIMPVCVPLCIKNFLSIPPVAEKGKKEIEAKE